MKKHIANTILLLALLLVGTGCSGWSRTPQDKTVFIRLNDGRLVSGSGLGQSWNPRRGIPQSAIEPQEFNNRQRYSSNGRTAMSTGRSSYQAGSLVWDPATRQWVAVSHNPPTYTWGYTNEVAQREYGHWREVGTIRHSYVEGPKGPPALLIGK